MDERILVVDDDGAVGEAACELLSAFGYRPTQAHSAAEALSFLHRENFAAVLTDYRMPGMNGIELARHLLRYYPGVPVAIMSGSPDTFPVPCLSKPYTDENLRQMVSDLVEQR